MANEGLLDNIELIDVKKVEEELYSTLDSEYKEFMQILIKGKITDDIKAEMHKICENVLAKF